jgi:hypothetical protein
MRRSTFGPLEQTKEPRWYAVRDMRRRVLEVRQLPSGADLKRVRYPADMKRRQPDVYADGALF